jgi:predicted nucleotidyltransferase
LKTRNKLLLEIKKLLIGISEIEFAFIFGSFGRNEDTELSDIDIAIYQTKHKSKYELIMLEFDIEVKLTERIPAQKFDVRCLNNAPIVVIGKIINEGELLFARDEAFLIDFIVKNRLKYMDYLIVYKPLLEKRYEELLDGR